MTDRSAAWRVKIDLCVSSTLVFFFQAEDGIRDLIVTGVQTCALPILSGPARGACAAPAPGAQSLRCERESRPRDEIRTSRLCPSLAIHHIPESCGHRLQRIGLEDDKIEALGEKISPFLERPGIVAAVQPGEQPRDGSAFG